MREVVHFQTDVVDPPTISAPGITNERSGGKDATAGRVHGNYWIVSACADGPSGKSMVQNLVGQCGTAANNEAANDGGQRRDTDDAGAAPGTACPGEGNPSSICSTIRPTIRLTA